MSNVISFRKSLKILDQYTSKLGKIGQLDSGEFGDKTRKCYKISVESNPDFNSTLGTFDSFITKISENVKTLSSYDEMKDTACTVINESLGHLARYAENTLWACTNSGYTAFTRAKGTAKTWKSRIEGSIISKIKRWTKCN